MSSTTANTIYFWNLVGSRAAAYLVNKDHPISGYRLKPVSYESAVRRWDYYGAIGSHKNHGFRPILFPDPEDQCVRHQPYTVNLPHFMTWLRPWDDFASGVVKVITNDGTSLSFMGAKL